MTPGQTQLNFEVLLCLPMAADCQMIEAATSVGCRFWAALTVDDEDARVA